MVEGLNKSGVLPVKVVYKGTANSSREVSELMKAANNDSGCAGVITWMHTFSPAKMWIHGLQQLKSRCCISTRSIMRKFHGMKSIWIS